jgi:hypothetical protein
MPWLILARKLPWRWIGVGAVLLLAWWQVAAWGGKREAEGVAKERERWEEAQRIAAIEHEAKVKKLNEDHDDATKKLQGRVDELLARPATRTIRVPVSAVCPAQGPDDAGVPVEDPGERLLEIDDPSYGVFRDWLIRYAGGPGTGG